MRCLLKFMNFINGDVIDKYQLDSIDFCNAPPKEIENFLSGLTRIICKENKYLKRINAECEVARHYTFTETTKNMIMQYQCCYEDKIASEIKKKVPKFYYHAMVLKVLLQYNFKFGKKRITQKDYCKIFGLREATISTYIKDIEKLNKLKHCLWDIEKLILF